jgi:signal peptidase I
MFLQYVQKYLLRVVTIVLQFFLIAFMVRFFILSPAQVNGQSMEDTLKDDDIILIDKISYLARSPERFEMVSAHDPREENVELVKRVIGLPGETVIFKNRQVVIQDTTGVEFEIYEPYVKTELSTFAFSDRPQRIYIPENHYFLLGDNREFSTDSREFGPVHRRLINGKVGYVNKWPDWFN